MEKTYNGWTNYATWRVNLELFDGQPCEWIRASMSQIDVAEQLKELVSEYLEADCASAGRGNMPLVLSYALAFISEVNWHEIAKHVMAEVEELDAYDTSEDEAA
jgi:hypothetical protein